MHLFLGFSAWNVLQHHSPLLISDFRHAGQLNPYNQEFEDPFANIAVELIHLQPMPRLLDSLNPSDVNQ